MPHGMPSEVTTKNTQLRASIAIYYPSLANSKFINYFSLHPIHIQRSIRDHQPILRTPSIMSSIPTSSSVRESAVIDAPLSSVWHLIKLEQFSQFWGQLQTSDFVKGASPDTDIVKWTFKDGTILEVKQEEHSVGNPFCKKKNTIVFEANSTRPLIISSHTLSLALSQHWHTHQSSRPFVSIQSPPASTKDTLTLSGLATSLAMLLQMSLKMPNTSAAKLWQIWLPKWPNRSKRDDIIRSRSVIWS
jgi:hypothetical protein